MHKHRVTLRGSHIARRRRRSRPCATVRAHCNLTILQYRRRQGNAARTRSSIRIGRPLAIDMNAHVVAARSTTTPSRISSVLRTHDAAFQLSTHVSATSD